MEIRLTQPSDYRLLSRYYSLNAPHFKPWEPEREADYYSEKKLRQRLKMHEKDHRLGSAAFFVALDDAQEAIQAHCSLTNILYGPMRACYMGYGVAEAHEGQGVMYRVCEHVIDYAFNNLMLNRVMANYMPCNRRSAALLHRLGFRVEGTARRYLKINGKWEDHVLTSLTNPKDL